MSAELSIGPFDVLVVGSGVAGLTAAVELGSNSDLAVGILTKGVLTDSATRWAQGGVAAVLSGDEDSTDLHLADTLAAGAGLCDLEAVRLMVDEGPGRVLALASLGAAFDREESGSYALAREGGHSRARVIHAGGVATGAEVERALEVAARESAAAVFEGWLATDLLLDAGRVIGVEAIRPDGEIVSVLAREVVLATGGGGQLFSVTTNPPEATADGLAMALRAGVPCADLEFMQFHPTALHERATPKPLLSEALRGHGAILRDDRGERFVDELAARDVVSRAMASVMAERRVDHLWLDATELTEFQQRFPTTAASLAALGIDPSKDWIPVAPAAHHFSGGVVTDLDGHSLVPGLWAIGEVACTGVHGANRLASNSLLEGMVFGARMVDALLTGRSDAEATGVLRAWLGGANEWTLPQRSMPEIDCCFPAGLDHDLEVIASARSVLQVAMTKGCGVVRSAASLASVDDALAAARAICERSKPSREAVELANLTSLATAVLAAAKAREESRGSHVRMEYEGSRDEWKLRLSFSAIKHNEEEQ